jgi:hypothetical protein
MALEIRVESASLLGVEGRRKDFLNRRAGVFTTKTQRTQRKTKKVLLCVLCVFVVNTPA